MLRLVASSGLGEEWTRRHGVVSFSADHPVARVFREHEPVRDASLRADGTVPEEDASVLVYPLMLGSRCAGAFLFDEHGTGPVDIDRNRHLLTVASICAHRFDQLVARQGGAAGAVKAEQRGVDGRPLPPLARDRSTMLEMAMSNAGIGSFDWDFASHQVFWDERVCQIFGILPDEFDHRIETFYDALVPEDRGLVDAAVADSARTGRYAVRYRFIRRDDGALRWLDAESRVVFDWKGEPKGMVGIVRDVTEEQTRDEQLQARRNFTINVFRALNTASSLEDVVAAVSHTAMPSLSADRMALFLRSDAGVMQLVGDRGFDEEYREKLRGLGRVGPHAPSLAPLGSGDPIFIGSRREFGERLSGVLPDPGPGMHAWIVLPLSIKGEPIGVSVIVFDRPRTFTPDERVLVAGLAGILAETLLRVRDVEERRAHLRELQSLMLPGELPPLPGLDFLVRYWPGSDELEVGGDWYDVLPVPGDRITLAIGDVQGHSASAAAVMGQLRVAMRTHAADGHELASLMRAANQSLCDMETELFATCCLVDIQPEDGTLRMVRAGHTHPMLVGPEGRCTSLTGPVCPPLGLFPYADGECVVTEAVLPEGGILLLYTDGLVETPGQDYDKGVGELAERLTRWAGNARASRGHPPDLEQLVEHVVTPVGRGPGRSDDIAVLVVRRRPERRT
ncbi:hypothetical protein GCM10010415_18590 [Streptomyces atrovirens]|uniref:SpoIIE family protein phosphatase n=2 Tax=Streptomyces atrovirens TaxID=285556 RepID=A0ABW0E2Y9_9ACTN